MCVCVRGVSPPYLFFLSVVCGEFAGGMFALHDCHTATNDNSMCAAFVKVGEVQ